MAHPIPEAPVASDEALRPYLAATDPDGASRALGTLVERDVRPLVARILRQKAASTHAVTAGDLEDLAAECTASLVERLVDLRAGRQAEPIASLSAYVAVVAYNAWHRHLRERFPVRTRLKNRLRYACGHHQALALWPDEADGMLCGLAAARGQPRSSPAAARLADAVARAGGIHDAIAGPTHPLSESDAAVAVLRWADGPVALDDLVDVVGPLVGEVDAPGTPASREAGNDAPASPVDALADQAPSALKTLTDREDLVRMWHEVEQLPVRQRQALLLNLRDGDGQGVIALLPLTGVATVRAIAATLDMTPEALAALWRELPLDDATIAARLGLTRQRVINLRKSARDRLGRRLRAPGGAGR